MSAVAMSPRTSHSGKATRCLRRRLPQKQSACAAVRSRDLRPGWPSPASIGGPRGTPHRRAQGPLSCARGGG
eukprot:3726728-Alexandrium_andersonii.AAC.1